MDSQAHPQVSLSLPFQLPSLSYFLVISLRKLLDPWKGPHFSPASVLQFFPTPPFWNPNTLFLLLDQTLLFSQDQIQSDYMRWKHKRDFKIATNLHLTMPVCNWNSHTFSVETHHISKWFYSPRVVLKWYSLCACVRVRVYLFTYFLDDFFFVACVSSVMLRWMLSSYTLKAY